MYKTYRTQEREQQETGIKENRSRDLSFLIKKRKGVSGKKGSQQEEAIKTRTDKV